MDRRLYLMKLELQGKLTKQMADELKVLQAAFHELQKNTEKWYEWLKNEAKEPNKDLGKLSGN